MKHINQKQNLLGEPETEEQHAYITRNFIGQEEVRDHAYLIENKRTSQGGPTGDERGNQ